MQEVVFALLADVMPAKVDNILELKKTDLEEGSEENY